MQRNLDRVKVTPPHPTFGYLHFIPHPGNNKEWEREKLPIDFSRKKNDLFRF